MDVILLTVELFSIIITAILTLNILWSLRLHGGISFAYFLTMITIGYVMSKLIQLNST
jgi:hypothetical protein